MLLIKQAELKLRGLAFLCNLSFFSRKEIKDESKPNFK